MFEAIRSLVRGGPADVRYVCRHCGATVDDPENAWPACGAPDVARYAF